jgi:hypothetical protein
MQTSTIWWLAAAGVLWSASGPLADRYAATQALTAKSSAAAITNQTDKLVAKQQHKRSAIAIERVKAGCSPIKQGDAELPLTDGASVAQPDGSPLTHGSIVCNSRGDTAIASTLDQSSTLTSIATAAPDDLPIYRDYYDRIIQNLGVPIVPSPIPSAAATIVTTET